MCIRGLRRLQYHGPIFLAELHRHRLQIMFSSDNINNKKLDHAGNDNKNNGHDNIQKNNVNSNKSNQES